MASDPSARHAETSERVASPKRSLTFSLRIVSFLVLSIVAIIPVLALASWVYVRALEDQVASVSDKHLVIAKNLGAALDRYADDLGNSFDLVARSAINNDEVAGLEAFLTRLHFVHLCVAELENGRVVMACLD
jgi:hypothetical protein